jgi:glycine cleavage system H protein
MNIPNELKYTKDHEWLRIEGNTAVIGITDYAQEQLGDIVFVEVPGEGDELGAGDTLGVVESVKAASDIYSPVSGTVVKVNEELADAPELVNQDPYGQAWIAEIELSNPDELAELLDSAAYEELTAEGGN